MAEVSGVEFRDIASGKIARNFNGAFDVLAESPGGRKPCRAIATTGGVVSIIGLDGVQVDLPDMGGAWHWDIQAIEILAGAGTVLY